MDAVSGRNDFQPRYGPARDDLFLGSAVSPVAINKFFHTVTSGFVLAAVVVIGYQCMVPAEKAGEANGPEKYRDRFHIRTLQFGVVASTGDGSAVQVAKTQPMKLAAMEALYTGEKEAGLVVFGVLRPEVGENFLFEKNDDAFYFKVEIPKLLSLMSFRNAEAFVPGINDLVFGNPEQQIIPIEGKMGLAREALNYMEEYRSAKASGDAVTQAYYNDLFDPNSSDGEYTIRISISILAMPIWIARSRRFPIFRWSSIPSA